MNTMDLPLTPDASGVTAAGTAWSSYGTGTPIVFIHGVGMNQSVWAPQVHGLRDEFQIVLFDMIGHGASSFDPGTRDLSDYAAQLAKLMSDLSIGMAHVVGHSMGALVALEMAISYTSLCKSVTAMNGVYCRTVEQRVSVQARAKELSTKGKPASVQETIYRWFGNPVPEKDQAAANLSSTLLMQVPLQGYAKAYEVFSNSDEWHLGRLGSIRVPTLIATGALDPNSSPAMARAMQAEIAGSQLETLADQRHMMNLIAVERVNALIRDFVKKHS